MKRLLLLTLFALLCTKASAQSFTLDEISGLLNHPDIAVYLTSKGFTVCKDCYGEGNPVIYTKNKGAANPEWVNCNEHSFDYFTVDLKLGQALLDEAKNKFALEKTGHEDALNDDRYSFTFYRFSNGIVKLQFLVFKQQVEINVFAN